LTDEDGDFLPGLEGFLSRADGFVEFFVSGLRDFVNELLGGGVVDVEPFSGLRVLELTIDEVLGGHGGETGIADFAD